MKGLIYGGKNLDRVRTVIGISGSSGVAYAARLLEVVRGEKILVVSENAKGILEHEGPATFEDLRSRSSVIYEDDDLFAPISSGSQKFDSMVIVPCSQSTLAKVANGIADTLITRAASVAMKEGRRLILVPRETPVSAIMLENELKLSRLGVMILPANPGFYHRPLTVADLVDFVVGKILDQLGQENSLYTRWKEGQA